MEYEKRVVAFIDILGFKNIVSNITNFDKIKKVANALKEEKKDTDKWNKIGDNDSFLETYFSDSLIMSSRLEYGGFFDLINQIAFIMQIITECGFVARGGISYGDLYHKDGVIFGPALIDAYNIESNIAIYPRVLMSEKTYNECLEVYDNVNDYKTRKNYCDVVVREAIINELGDKYYYIDYLNQMDSYDFEIGWIELLKKAKNIIQTAFSNIKDKHVLDKYRWFENYLKEVLIENDIDYKTL